MILTSLSSSDDNGCQPLSLVLYPIIILAYVCIESNFMSVPELHTRVERYALWVTFYLDGGYSLGNAGDKTITDPALASA